MPRNIAFQKDLSQGWHDLYALWALSLDEKIDVARRMLKTSLKTIRSPVICWSGGKDSTVVLHLVLQQRPDIPVIHVDSGVDFKETTSFVEKLRKDWNLSLHIARPADNLSFLSIGEKFGWPILGKNITSNVERARRTGNIRPQLSTLEIKLVAANAHISTKCALYLQEKPSQMIEQQLTADAKIIGIRAEESRARVRLWVDHGDKYFVKRYFGRGKGIWKINPIAAWTESDIWAYHRKHDIPVCDLYKIGYPRNGCWTCAMAVRNGQLKRLRTYHPNLFNKLVFETPMGMELLKIKRILSIKHKEALFKTNNLETILTKEPAIFDSI